MSGWDITAEQWRSWALEDAPAVPPLDRVDDFDASLREQLERARFPAGDETTLMRPTPAASFDSMTTMIREAPVAAASSDAVTVVTPGADGPGLAVTLVPPGGGSDLEVTLRPPPREAPSPVPSPAVADLVDDDDDDDELYIPSLTKSRAAPSPASLEADPLPPPPDFAFDGASAPDAIGVTDAWERHASGELGGSAAQAEPEPEPVPPRRRVEVTTPDAGTSQTSGVIQMQDDDVVGSSVRGAPDQPDPPVAKAKIVVDPSASGTYEQVADDDVEELAEAAEELDEADLEEEEPLTSLAVDEVAAEPSSRATSEAPLRSSSSPPPPTVDSATLAAADVHSPPPARTGHTLPPQGSDLAWVDAAFGEHYFALLPDNREQRAQEEVAFVLACTQTPPGARVLDVGCGDGAHCFAFAARGMQVTGFDASMAQLMRATQLDEARGNPVAFLQGDMRDPPVQGAFALVTCLGSTFGYFDDATNERVLDRMARFVAPGGHLVLHVFNRERMVGRLPARSWWQGRGCLVLDEASFDSLTSRLAVHRTVVFEDGRQFDHTVTMRAFGLSDLAELCRRVGLRLQEYSGGIHTRGRFFGSTSSDIWLVARRPEA